MMTVVHLRIEDGEEAVVIADWCGQRGFDFDAFSPNDPAVILMDVMVPPAFATKAQRLFGDRVTGMGRVRM